MLQVQQVEERFTAEIEAVLATTGLALDWDDNSHDNDEKSNHDEYAMSAWDEQ